MTKIHKNNSKKKWRDTSSWYSKNTGSIHAIQTLIGNFLSDRDSKSLLSNVGNSAQVKKLSGTWGTEPFEKIIKEESDLNYILNNPDISKNAISIIEPSDHVGENPKGEGVRASANIAYISRMVADCDSILFPLWESGISNIDNLKKVLQNSLAIIVEGGYPSAKDKDTFADSKVNLKELQLLMAEIILSRVHKSTPAIFICLGHQIAAQAHINLIKKAVKEMTQKLSTVIPKDSYQHEALISMCERIKIAGEGLKVLKNNSVVAKGWNDPHFAVALNEVKEVGKCELKRYSHDGRHPSNDFKELLIKHNQTASEYDGIVEQSITYEKNLELLMFHSDEVNEEAILFANWAYSNLHNTLASSRDLISVSSLSWLLNLPSSVEILCSTSEGGKKLTDVAATCINYKDYETHKVRRSFSFQFHPELLADLREFNISGSHDYILFKNDDGIRMLMRVLYECILD